MHDDAAVDDTAWEPCIHRLRRDGTFQGGSAIGGGVCVRKSAHPPPVTARIAGFIQMKAEDLDHAILLLAGNPQFEVGGMVEIRVLPRTD